MLVSYKWLKELANINVATHELSEEMSTARVEVGGISASPEGLTKLVVGHVVSYEDVSKTHLHPCQVDTGDEKLRQIICDAPNVTAGIGVIVAIPGARIADNCKIKKDKIRGMEPLGMICPLQEPGLPDSIIPKEFSDGIQVLPEDAKPGDNIFPYLDLDDEVAELSVTSGRADAFSMRDVAHGVVAIYGKEAHFPKKELKEVSEAAKDVINVAIESDEVLAYKAHVVENVTVKPSPQWLQNPLMNADIRSINNVIDVANYVLLYFGQPTHVLDLNKFENNKIIARNTHASEKLVILDGEGRGLIAEDLVITVADKPVVPAGVMGGQATEIGGNSKDAVFEAAIFDGTSIHKTSGRLGLRSESSPHFRKGISYTAVAEALDFAVVMPTESAGGDVLASRIEAGSVLTEDVEVSTALDYVNVRLETELTYADIEDVFVKLSFGLSGNADKFTASVPCRRWDITIQVGLVEEVARVYGYDNLPTTLPEAAGTAGELTAIQKSRHKMRSIAEGAGLTEVVSYALATPEKATEFTLQSSNLTELVWSMSVERSVPRQNAVSGTLNTVTYNVTRRNSSLTVYEISKVFEQRGNPKEKLPSEVSTFAFTISGLATEKGFQTKATPVDFFCAKGIVEAIFAKLDLTVDYVAEKGLASMHPGRTAGIYLGDQLVGSVGRAHPQTAKNYNASETYMAESNLDIIEATLHADKAFAEITKFPAVSRDIALLLPAATTHKEILAATESVKAKRLTDVKLFGTYAEASIAEGMKSMAYGLAFQNPNDNLTDKEVAKYMDKITKVLVDQLGAEVR